ncbi:MAG: hypothetical protein QXQ29_04050 [Candidatus Bathyarchaeia archaeon]
MNLVKKGGIKTCILYFTLYGISVILGKPDLVARFLSEVNAMERSISRRKIVYL